MSLLPARHRCWVAIAPRAGARRPRRAWRRFGWERLEERIAPAIAIQFDYSLDTLGFFTANPGAKTVLQEAAQTLGSELNDNLSAIIPNPAAGNIWQAFFPSPSNTANQSSSVNLSIPANTLLVYVGGSVLSGSDLAESNPGTVVAIGSQAWSDLVHSRGQSGALASPATDWGPWGGTISFNTTSNWSFSGTGGLPGGGQLDFLTEATHELCDLLGYGQAPSWFNLADKTTQLFSGPHAEAVYGGPVPIDPPAFQWAEGTFGGTTIMNASLALGVRKQMTSLDWAGLADIGWNVDQLVVTKLPPSSVADGTGFDLIAQAEYPNSQPDSLFNGTVTLALANNPGGATLSGMLTATASSGVALFSGLTLNRLGSGYTLTVSSGNLARATTTTAINVTNGPATQLVVTTQPPTSVTAQTGFGLTVTAEDAFGNVDPNFVGLVALTNNSSGAALGGTAAVNAVKGVATFSGLLLNQAMAGYTLLASSTGVSSALTGTFTVNAAAAMQWAVTVQPPGNVVANSGFSLVAKAEDSFGNVNTNYQGGAALTLSSNPGSATLSGMTSVSAVSGVASFSGLSLDKADPGYTLKVSGGGLANALTGTITVSAAPATQWVVTAQPPGRVTAGNGFGLTVKAEDASGNFDSTIGGSVSLALSSNPGGATLSGTATATVVGGVASFSGLSLDKADPGYTLEVSGAGLLSTLTGMITVNAAAAVQWVVTAQPPGNVVANSGFSLVAKAEDSFGNVNTNYQGGAALSLSSNPGSATLSGMTSVSAASGVASFSGLSLDKADPGYTLKVSGGGLADALTGTITVSAAPATQWVVTAQPPGSVTAGNGFGLTVKAEDASGNFDSTIGGSVSLALSSNPGGATLSGTVSVPAVGGVASFAGLSLDKADPGYTLEVSGDGLLSTLTGAITVNAGMATQWVVTTQPPISVSAGDGFVLVVEAEDQLGNLDMTFGGSANLALASSSGGQTLGGNLSTPAAGGVAMVSGLTLSAEGMGNTLQVTGAGLRDATTSPISVSPSKATQLVVMVQPPGSLNAETGFGLIVTAEDEFGNIDSTYSGNVTLALAGNPGGGSLAGTLSIQARGGVATFTGLSLDRAAAGYTIGASSGTLTGATTSAITVNAAPATQWVVAMQPPKNVAAGGLFGLVVEAEDGSGNIDPTYGGAVMLALASNPGGATLGGTVSVSATAGVATFTNLTLNKVAAGFTIAVSGGSLTGATTRSITVAPQTATQLVVTTAPPASITAGSDLIFAVSAEDQFGNIDPTFRGSVIAALAANPGGATLGGTLTATAVAGVATFTNLSLDKVATGDKVAVSSSGLAGALTGAITVNAAPATQWTVTIQPPGSVTAGSGFGLMVKAEDSFGNVDPDYSGSVTLAPASNPGGATLGGTTTLAAVGGVVTFANLSLNKAASGYTLNATGGGLTAATTDAITVTPAPATQLIVTEEPPVSVTAGTGFGLVVKAEDAFGNTDSTYRGSVTIALAINPTGATLGGQATVTAAEGFAMFAGLTLDKAGPNDVLQAKSSSLTPAATSTIAVNAAPATQLVVTVQPPGSVAAGTGFGLVVAAEDAFGNVDPNFRGSVTLAQANNPAGATLGGTIFMPAAGGVATFANLTLDKDGPGDTLTASSGGWSVVTSAIAVIPAPATQLVVTTQPPGSINAGAGFGLAIATEDGAGNVDTTYLGSVTLALASISGGGSLGGTLTLPVSDGVAAFNGLTLDKPLIGYTLQASANGLNSTTTNSFAINAAPATQLVISTEPPADVTAGGGFGLVVEAEDGFGNLDTSYGGSVVLAPGINPAGATLGGTSTVAATGGVARFANLSLDKAGAGATLVATSTGLSGAATSTITVNPAPATQWVVTAQPPSSVTAGTAFTLVVSAEDDFGNVDANNQGGATLALSSNPGGATLGGTLNATAVSGVARFAGLSLNLADSGYTLQVSGGGLSVATTNPITVQAAPATHWVLTEEPPADVVAGAGFGLTVQAEDAFGNVDPTETGSVALAPLNNPGGATLGGTTTVAAVDGVATLASLSLDKAAMGETLRASGASLASATTAAFTVNAASATQLVVTAEPPNSVTAGAGFGVVIEAEDPFGNIDANFQGTVTLALAGATLRGPATVTADSGVATFANLSLNETSSGEELNASASGLTGALTSPITVNAAPATQLVVTAEPPASVKAGAGFGLVIEARDAFGNVDANFQGTVTLALAGDPPSADLNGTATVTAVGGVATFANLSLEQTASSETLQATSGALTAAATSPITVNPAPATKLVVTTGPPADVTAGSGFGLVVRAEDAFGNVDPTYSGNVTLSLASNPAGATLGGTLMTLALSGVASFAGLTLDSAASGDTLEASSGGLTAATTAAVAVNAASATHLVVTSQPPVSIIAGVGFGLTVEAEDAFGNIDPTANGAMILVLASNPGGGSLGGPTTSAVVHGVATSAGLTLNKSGAGYTVEVSDGGLTATATNPIVVAPAQAAQLVVLAQPPGNVTAGTGFGLAVAAEDGFGNVDTSFTGNVTLALANNPGGASLGGPTTAAAAHGVATFAGLSLNKAGDSFVIQATGGGLIGAVADPIGVIPSSVTVENVSLQPEHVSKHKTTTVIVVQFSDALDAASAANLGTYSLSTVAQGKKHKSKHVALGRPTYNAVSHTVTLTPRKKLVLSPPLQLRINALDLTDALGRPLDGNHDGQPGGDFVATLSKRGVSIALFANSVDEVIGSGFRTRSPQGER